MSSLHRYIYSFGGPRRNVSIHNQAFDLDNSGADWNILDVVFPVARPAGRPGPGDRRRAGHPKRSRADPAAASERDAATPKSFSNDSIMFSC